MDHSADTQLALGFEPQNLEVSSVVLYPLYGFLWIMYLLLADNDIKLSLQTDDDIRWF